VAEYSVFFSKFSHTKNNFSRVSPPLEGVTLGGKETTAKKGHHFQRRWLKSQFYWKKRVTPSVAAPGETNPSDATVRYTYSHAHVASKLHRLDMIITIRRMTLCTRLSVLFLVVFSDYS